MVSELVSPLLLCEAKSGLFRRGLLLRLLLRRGPDCCGGGCGWGGLTFGIEVDRLSFIALEKESRRSLGADLDRGRISYPFLMRLAMGLSSWAGTQVEEEIHLGAVVRRRRGVLIWHYRLVIGAGASAGYIAESPDPQKSELCLKGGGATTAMRPEFACVAVRVWGKE